ncbi:MAG: hypothetical protein FWH53_04430 [Leptospirales bacterium]|nr:hypothetical protein [Leptospirales bacterium]
MDLVDINGFSLETIVPDQWIRSVDSDNKAKDLTAKGNLSISLEKYFEISDWEPRWKK